MSIVPMLKTVILQAVMFRICTEFNCKKYIYFMLFSLVQQFLFKQLSLV